MAVIESKGDGYSLFNGVKLLNLPEYDKENFPCAMVIRYDDGEQYRLYVSKNPFYWETSEQCCECAENTIATWKLTDSASNWEVYKSAYYTAGMGISDAFIPAWSNYDILNSPDNSVYLAASEPISLDGMNVIEWDGDTTGLSTSGRLFKVADYIPTSNACTVLYSNIQGDVYYEFGDDFSTTDTGWRVKLSNTTMSRGSVNDNATYLLYGHENGYVCLLAYYPIEEEPEMSKAKFRLIHEMFSPVIAHAMTGKWFPWRKD